MAKPKGGAGKAAEVKAAGKQGATEVKEPNARSGTKASKGKGKAG